MDEFSRARAHAAAAAAAADATLRSLYPTERSYPIDQWEFPRRELDEGEIYFLHPKIENQLLRNLSP